VFLDSKSEHKNKLTKELTFGGKVELPTVTCVLGPSKTKTNPFTSPSELYE
jgi:hypothetical protein